MNPSTWTPDRVAILKRLWEKGSTSGEIASLLGIGRGAVTGKAMRLNLGKRSMSQEALKREKGVRAVRFFSASWTPRVKWVAHTDQISKPEPFIPAPDPVQSKGASIVDLNPGVCRWPIGDPKHVDFCYCGNETDITKNYCSHHTKLARVQT